MLRASFFQWFAPRSTDIRDIFRERVLRVTTGFYLIVSVFFLLVIPFLYHGSSRSIDQIEIQLVFASVAIFALLSTRMLGQGRLDQAGWLIVILTIATGCGVLVAQDGQYRHTSLALYMTAIMMAAMLLPPRFLAPVSLGAWFSFIAMIVFTNITDTADVSAVRLLYGDVSLAGRLFVATYAILNHGTFIGCAYLILRAYRQAYDARLLEAQQRRLEAEAAQKRAEQAERMKGQFLANMSHELRTPLNAILGFSTILATDVEDDPETRQDMMQSIMRMAQHLNHLINDLLDLSKIEAGQMKLYPEPTDITLLFQQVLADMRSLSDAKLITLQDNPPPDHFPSLLLVDKTRLKQILTNLVGNAIKFTEQGRVSIQWSYDAEEQRWSFTVNDTGQGIPPEAQAYIFEVFRQVDGSSTREKGGTGLGLAIVQRLVEMMEGNVSVQSTLHHGSTFRVTLPAVIPSATDAVEPVPIGEGQL